MGVLTGCNGAFEAAPDGLVVEATPGDVAAGRAGVGTTGPG